MIIPQGYPLMAVSPDGIEYLVIGWHTSGATTPNAILAGYDRVVKIGAVDGWSLVWLIDGERERTVNR